MPIVAVIVIVFSIMVAGVALPIVVFRAIRDWQRTAADIADRRRRVSSDRAPN